MPAAVLSAFYAFSQWVITHDSGDEIHLEGYDWNFLKRETHKTGIKLEN